MGVYQNQGIFRRLAVGWGQVPYVGSGGLSV